MITVRHLSWLIGAVALISLPASVSGQAHSAPQMERRIEASPGAPNVVLILLDDVGFGDTSTFGGPAQTPELNRLAAQGLRYNTFHTAAVCSPTRAALLSGRNPHRVGFGGFGGVELPGYDGIWKKNVAPLAELLRRNGYSTAAFGKWHNTPYHEITPVGPFDRWPTGLGFEYFYGNLVGWSSQWEPPLWRNTQSVAPPSSPREGYHYTTDITDDAIRWLYAQQSLAPDKPYFLYFATGAVHVPHHVPREWIDRYRGRFDRGWDELRKETFARQKKLGVIPANAQLTPRPAGIRAWNSFSAEERKLLARQMETFAGFVAHTDHEVGRLIRAVQEGPRGKDTLIIYIVGDNGPDTAGGESGTDNLLAQLMTSSAPPRSVADQLRDLDRVGGPASNLNHYAFGWSWAGSTPFQWMKFAASHFGGTRNPLVVSWPARIRDRGGLRTQFTDVIDVTPTVLEAAGIRFPGVVDGIEQTPLDGMSFAYSFERAEAPTPSRTQYFEFSGNRAIYQDGWMASALHTDPLTRKALRSGADSFAQDHWELYHVAEDFSQAHDLAARYPQKLQELRELFDLQARDNQVFPLGAPAGQFHSPAWSPQNGEYRYYASFPGVSLVSGAAPDFGKSHRVTAEVSIPENGAQGVIMAAGGRDGGFALYVQDRRLVYEQNSFGRTRTMIVSRESLPSGEVMLGYDFYPRTSAMPEALVRLYIQDKPVGEGVISYSPASVLDNFDVGQDTAAPVSESYLPPNTFTGTLKMLTVRLQ